jgi:hypothetical protein
MSDILDVRLCISSTSRDLADSFSALSLKIQLNLDNIAGIKHDKRELIAIPIPTILLLDSHASASLTIAQMTGMITATMASRPFQRSTREIC